MFERCDTYVLLGDSKTRKLINGRVHLDVDFLDHNGRQHSASDWFYVLETGHECVVGLPLLTRGLRPLFDQLLDYYGVGTEYPSINELNLGAPHTPSPLLVPWTQPPELAPEDEDTPLPVNFGEHVPEARPSRLAPSIAQHLFEKRGRRQRMSVKRMSRQQLPRLRA